jgi:dihydropteroate synthase
MRRCGATESGIQRMLTKASCVAVAMENVGRRQANLLKQEMLAAGGDVAVSHGVCSEEVAATGVVLMGTRRQFESLLARLAEEPFDLPALGGYASVSRRAIIQHRVPLASLFRLRAGA